MQRILNSLSGLSHGLGLGKLAGLSFFLLTGLAGCQKPAETEANRPATNRVDAAAEEANAPGTAGSEKSTEPQPPQEPGPVSRNLPEKFSCGEHQCLRFSSAREVLVPLLLRDKPRVIGFGEAHAPATFRGETTVNRFTEQILPTFSEGASYLILELLAPPATGCDEAKKEAQKEADTITEGQSRNNQNEYLKLGTQAREQGVVPDILRASCDDMKKIASEDGGVLAYMDTIGRLFVRDITARLGQTKKGRPFVIAYGGALHNDAQPRPGREAWSYGPEVATAADHAYLEIDLIIPELIQDTDSWRSFPWYAAYQALPDKSGTLLMQWGEHSYSLFFSPAAPVP